MKNLHCYLGRVRTPYRVLTRRVPGSDWHLRRPPWEFCGKWIQTRQHWKKTVSAESVKRSRGNGPKGGQTVRTKSAERRV